MRKLKQIQLTTVCVDTATRDFINEESERLSLPQRETISRMIEKYQSTINCNKGSPPPEEQITQINEALKKVIARDDRIVAFIKEQEKVLLTPILNGVLESVEWTKSILTYLQQFENNDYEISG